MVKIFKFLKPCGTKKDNYGRGPKKLLVKILPPQPKDSSEEDAQSPKEAVFDVEAPCTGDYLKELLINSFYDDTVSLDDIKLIYRGRILISDEFLDQEVYRAAEVGDDSDVEEEECTYSVWASVFTKEDEEELEAELKGEVSPKGPKSKQMKKRMARQKSKEEAMAHQASGESQKYPLGQDSKVSWTTGQESIDSFQLSSMGLKRSAETISSLQQSSKLNFQSTIEVGTAMEAEAFDIVQELTNIGCDRWAHLFISEGYSQQGAFANLSEKVLQAHPFFMHKEARRKVLLLADMMKRHQAVKDSSSLLQRINSSASSNSKYTIDGKTFYDNLAELDYAWKNREDEEKKREAQPPPPVVDKSVSRKHYSRHIREVMERVKRRNTLDEYGVPLEVHPYLSRQGWCCEKHNRSVNARVDQLVRRKVEEVMVEVEFKLWEGDEFGSGFIPPSMLYRIASSAFKRCVMPESPAVLKNIVDPCYEEGNGLWVDQKMFRQQLGAKLTEEYRSKMI